MGKTNEMGKPKFEDISQGNITLPMIILLKNKNTRSCKKYSKKKGRFKSIEMMLMDLNIINTCFDIAEGHIKAKVIYLLSPVRIHPKTIQPCRFAYDKGKLISLNIRYLKSQ